MSLKEVVGSDSYRVNNKLDDKYEPLPVGKIIASAERQVGKVIDYGLLTYNCEHWVNDMRYGKPESRQVSACMSLTNRTEYVFMISWPLKKYSLANTYLMWLAN